MCGLLKGLPQCLEGDAARKRHIGALARTHGDLVAPQVPRAVQQAAHVWTMRPRLRSGGDAEHNPEDLDGDAGE